MAASLPFHRAVVTRDPPKRQAGVRGCSGCGAAPCTTDGSCAKPPAPVPAPAPPPPSSHARSS